MPRSEKTLSSAQAEMVERALNKAELLREQLAEFAQEGYAEDVQYGPHDPFRVQAATCDTCGHKHVVPIRTQQDPERWQIICPECGKKAPEVSKTAWAACLAWNAVNLETQDYRDIPMFGLEDLTPDQAMDHLAIVRETLEVRTKLASCLRVAAKVGGQFKPPGRSYRHRLGAYMQWCMLGQRLAKLAKGTK